MHKPIETIYAGKRFRSRLEARWAVFFTKLGLKWEYEKEGFQIPELSWGAEYLYKPAVYPAHWYLPDFWLPALKLWIEVKPKPDTGDFELADAQHHLMLKMGTVMKHLGGGYVVWGEPNVGQWENLIGRSYVRLRMFALAEQAAEEACHARFEHGETPSTSPLTFRMSADA